MRKCRRGLAAVMALLLMVPAQPAMAEKPSPPSRQESVETASPGNAKKEQKAEKQQETSAKKASVNEEIVFNTGNHEYHVVSKNDFVENGLGDAFFEEDGSYTINIPEANPFFPYEVEFTVQGKRTKHWFMTPDDQVRVGGHTFYVSAYFDETAVTQMSLNIGGDTIVVYPEKKKFTNDEEAGTEPASLLPLESRSLEVDLSAYTPVELTMVSVNELFMGEELTDSDKVIWSREGQDDYTISMPGDRLDLSYDTYYDSSVSWEMIVGDDNQLAAENIRYNISVKVTPSRNWLIPTVYKQSNEGKREKLDILRAASNWWYGRYHDEDDERWIVFSVSSEQLDYDENAYVSFALNDSIFAETKYDQIKAYEGKFTYASEAASGTEITDKLFHADMTEADAGYVMTPEDEPWVTIVTFDAGGNATGCLPIYLVLHSRDISDKVYSRSLQGISETGEKTINVVSSTRRAYHDGVCYETHILDKGYAVNKTYYLSMHYSSFYDDDTASVIAAYVGKYSSIQEAEKAGAVNIKDELFDSRYGYGADYSDWVSFTIFAGDDGVNAKETYVYFVKAEEGEIFSYATDIYFSGLRDSRGHDINAYIVDEDDDSYAEKSYRTILVDEDVDLTYLAPEFYNPSGHEVKLYAVGSSTPEVSGKSFHDFSKGPIQYTISTQDGIEARNIWLQIVKVGVGNGTLYLNSLGDEKANTRVENGITYSTREMFLDGRYDYLHDIVLINLGSESISAISAELVSDEVELDKYWMLNGEYPLLDISNRGKLGYGQWNLAKLRIRPKDGMADGRDITGTLTIKSGENVLIVLTLTGTVGDPSITTKEIPQAVKYVPYGTMIQNSNKYSWNRVSYQIIRGKLPEGMELKPNGELYGVPTEMGEFEFTVRMTNSYDDFISSEKTFTLTVIENTDANVDDATDEGYILTQRVQNMSLDAAYDQTLVSQGVYDEFTDVFLDGVKLTKDVDYTSESGSTRITIRGETLKANNTTGRHTLGIEFRSGEEKTLKRAAQNYENTARRQNSNSNSSSSGTRNKKRSIDLTASTAKPQDAKKGYIDAQTGIITGEGIGYSRWQKDELGWRLIYADGTAASGSAAQLPDGTTVEQILWEQVNGAWYAFGITGYMKSGWVYDYQLNRWYCLTPENGLYFGWYGDAQDNCVYYLEPGSGNLAVGWKMIDEKWYYFHEAVQVPTWNFNAVTGQWVYNALSGNKPYGSMYHNERTPDGYFVGVDGVWDGQDKE